MGTRSNVQFKYGNEKYQLYKHWDGYPDYMIPDIAEFIKWNKGRSDDISYTVANYIVWSKLKHCDDPKKEFADPNGNSVLHTGIGLTQVTKDFDGSYIEWFYVVDLKKQTVSVYNPKEKTGEVSFSSDEKLEKLLTYVPDVEIYEGIEA